MTVPKILSESPSNEPGRSGTMPSVGIAQGIGGQRVIYHRVQRLCNHAQFIGLPLWGMGPRRNFRTPVRDVLTRRVQWPMETHVWDRWNA